QVGFPIVVAGFVLIRIEPKLSKLIEAITELIPIVKQDSKNTEDMKKAISDFRLEVSRINGRK
ncbi:YvrJ family protein, partial [Candidatus Pacearchaeota archaeon]|nr:YvrJ family protein [Candidatus Pacearchaeota archaeon]